MNCPRCGPCRRREFTCYRREGSPVVWLRHVVCGVTWNERVEGSTVAV